MSNPILVNSMRGDVIENRHRGAVAEFLARSLRVDGVDPDVAQRACAGHEPVQLDLFAEPGRAL